MKQIYHSANSRGLAEHSWLTARHSFSFASYHDPNRMGFGKLRVLNDDSIDPGMGFGTHPHSDMEIITIPLEGALEHKDSMGNSGVIPAGDIQVMSAGSGITHSEFNHHQDQNTKLLQIWVETNAKGAKPRYDQINLPNAKNELQQILSPNPDDAGVWIHQNAWFHMGTFDHNTELEYSMKGSNNGIYAFVIHGEVQIEEQALSKRDALGIWETEKISISAQANSKVLIMEVPIL